MSAPNVSLDVTFTVKELFLEIRKDLRELNVHVNELERRGSDQAQRAIERIEEVNDQVKQLEERVTRLQLSTASREGVEAFKAQVSKLTIGVLISIAGMMLNVILFYFKR